MKKITTFILLLISVSINAQIYEAINYGNTSVGLLICSDNTYSLSSENPLYQDPGDIPSDEPSLPRVIWSEGTYVYLKDTLVCRDNDGRRVCYFLKKKGGNLLRISKFIGFGKETSTNKQKIYDHIKKNSYVARIQDLFMENPEFYIASKYFTDKKRHNRPYEFYVIKGGIHKLVLKHDKNEIRKEFEREQMSIFR